MSHEIRTPLRIIQGFAELAMDKSLTIAARNDFLKTIRRNSNNLTKLIGEILDLTKVEAGLVDLEHTQFSFLELATEVISTFELEVKKKDLSLRFQFENSCPPFIVSDQMRLWQILINVISNALKFTAPGEIILTVSAFLASTNQEQTSVQFFIKDTGIGISADNQSRLFQPFVQTDSSTTRKFGGTGLGLSLSKKLAQALSGDLELIESDPSKGSIFALAIKNNLLIGLQHNQKEQFTSDSTGGTSDVLQGLKVLLVEDLDDNQQLFSTYLLQAGAEVDEGADGVLGVQLALKKTYDVILMDVQMPNLDGYGARTQLRASSIKTPIIAMTSHALKEDCESALTNGFTNYLTKPLESKLLGQTLLPRKKTAR